MRLLPIALCFFLGSTVALGINIRGEQNGLAVWRPEFTAGFGGHRSHLPDASYASTGPIERGHPNLRSLFFRREESEGFPIRRPTRTVGILIGDDLSLLTSGRRHDPDVRRLRIGLEIHIDHAEDHPLAVGRNLRLADALQLHHVFESKGMLDLREGGQRKNDEGKKNEKETAHEGTSTANA